MDTLNQHAGRIALSVIGALALLLSVAGCGAKAAEIELDPTTVFQVSKGWEVTPGIGEEALKAWPRYQKPVVEAAVEFGVNRVRLEVRSGAENRDRNWERMVAGEITGQQWRPLRYATLNDNDDPNVIDWSGFDFAELDADVANAVLPLREELARRGERLYVNLCYVAFTGQLEGRRFDHDNPDEYAEFVLATYLHMQQKWGFVPDAWEVMLEPDNTHWDGRALGERIVKAAARLKKAGFTPRFIAPSVTDMSNAPRFIDQIAATPGAMQYVDELSYHRYRGVSTSTLRAIAARAERYGKSTAMLEWWFGNAKEEVLREDLVVGRNGAWQGQVLLDLVDLDKSDPTRVSVKIKDNVRLHGQYFRYIRFGARRIGAKASPFSRAEPVAYINRNGAYAVVVRSDIAQPVTVRGLSPGRYRVSWSSATRSEELPGVLAVAPGGLLSTRIPEPGVISIYDDRLPPRPAPAAQPTPAARTVR